MRISRDLFSEGKGFVYFILDPVNNWIKIGKALDVGSRLNSLKTANPQIQLIKSIPGGFGKETEIHWRFDHLRNAREWFQATQELWDYINSLDEHGNEPLPVARQLELWS